MSSEVVPASELEEAPAEAECADEEVVQASQQQSVKRRGTVTGQPIKRPRWGDKAFEEITIADVEKLVRRCNLLEKQVETNAEAAQQLKDAQKKEKELAKEASYVSTNEVAQVKSALSKQLLAQMIYTFAWNESLKGSGREICAYLPNVTHEMLKALGGDVNVTTKKQVKRYFEKLPCKNVPPPTSKAEKPEGNALVLHGHLVLKYIKTTSELHVKATYKFGDPEKQQPRKGKGKGKAAIADGNVTDGAAEDSNNADIADAPADGDDNTDKVEEEAAEEEAAEDHEEDANENEA